VTKESINHQQKVEVSTTKIVRTALLCLLACAAFWARYYFSVKDANRKGRETACTTEKEQEFLGQIVAINRFEYDNFMHGRFFNLRIKMDKSNPKYVDYHYNLKPNIEILDFARVGQKVVKMKGEDICHLTDSTGLKATFKIGKCAAIE
jgi:hypothetical protein